MNPDVTSPGGLAGIWAPLATRPLTYSTFWLNYRLGGSNAAGYAVFGVGLHLAAVLLLWIVLRRALPAPAAWIAAAVFAAHPIQAEAVNYIFERATLLAALLCIASLRAWFAGAPWQAVAWFAAALAAKEECVAFPLFLLLPHFRKLGPPRVAAPIAAMMALALAAGLRAMAAARAFAGSGAGASSAYPWEKYFAAEGAVIWRYLRMIVLPWGFTVDPDIAVPRLAAACLAWVGVAALVAVALVAARRGWDAGWWFVGGIVLLLPSSSVFPASDLAADRRVYLPMIGFAACIGLCAARLGWRVPAAVIAVLAALAIARTAVWHSDERLWSDAAAKAPRKIRPKIQLARALPPDRALPLLEVARRLAPRDPRPAAEEGRIYLGLGDAPRALAAFGEALADAPADPLAYNNRGAALAALGQPDAARADFERALSLDACEFNALVNLRRLGVARTPPARCRFTADQIRELGGT